MAAMRFPFLALATCLALPFAGRADDAACPGPGEAEAYASRHAGEAIEFEVLRNGKPVGIHRTRFRQRDGYLVVDSEMALSIRFMFIEAYRYHYTATERWCEGHLVQLEATVDDNGERTRTEASAAGDRLEIAGPGGRSSAPLGVFSTNHWHAGVLDSEEVLNTLTGNLNSVRIRRCATPNPDGEGPAGATCYDYTGDLDARVWYDAEGRWVGLAFDGTDGSRFEYRCASCKPRPAAL